MKRRIHYNAALILSCIILTLSFGCSDDPTAPEADITTTLEVSVTDENGEPYANTYVTLYPSEYTKRTRSDGVAVFSGIKTGSYQVLIDDVQLPYYTKNVTVKQYKTNTLEFIIASEVTVNIYLHDTDGEPITDVELTTVPGTQAIISDENGVAVLEKIPVDSYRFVIKRGEYTYTTDAYRFSITNGEIDDIIIIIPSQAPDVEIAAPWPGDILNGLESNTFKGDGWDFEDVVLPDEAFSWTSSLDGELGTGREITVDHLNVGYHTITFQATDSHGVVGSYTFTIGVINYQYDSWFPLAYQAEWMYRYLTPEFTIENEDGTVEDWVLNDLYVDMPTLNSRESALTYNITFSEGDSILYVRYYDHIVTDMFESVDNNLYLTNTTEIVSVKQYNPVETDFQYAEWEIITSYSPSHTILRNYNDPLPGDSHNEIITAQVTRNYDLDEYSNYIEQMDLKTSYAVEDKESITVDTGTYETLPVVMTINGTGRKWWLARGYGIVQIEYDMHGFPMTAVLWESTVDDIRAIYETTAEKAPSHKMPSGAVPVIVSPFESPHDSPGRILEMSRFIRNIIP